MQIVLLAKNLWIWMVDGRCQEGLLLDVNPFLCQYFHIEGSPSASVCVRSAQQSLNYSFFKCKSHMKCISSTRTVITNEKQNSLNIKKHKSLSVEKDQTTMWWWWFESRNGTMFHWSKLILSFSKIWCCCYWGDAHLNQIPIHRTYECWTEVTVWRFKNGFLVSSLKSEE